MMVDLMTAGTDNVKTMAAAAIAQLCHSHAENEAIATQCGCLPPLIELVAAGTVLFCISRSTPTANAEHPCRSEGAQRCVPPKSFPTLPSDPMWSPRRSPSARAERLPKIALIELVAAGTIPQRDALKSVAILARFRHRRWHVRCAGMDGPVPKITASPRQSFWRSF